MAQLLDFGDADDTSAESGIRQGSAADFSTIELVRDVLERVRRGMPIDFDAIKVDANSRFFILGLSPNSSRISVRFWQVDTFGNMVHRVAQHHADLAIVPPSYAKNPYISVRAILRDGAVGRLGEDSSSLGGRVNALNSNGSSVSAGALYHVNLPH